MTDPLTEMLASLKERLRAATPAANAHALDLMVEQRKLQAALDPDLVAALIGCVEALEVYQRIFKNATVDTKYDGTRPDNRGRFADDALAQLRKLAEGRTG